MLDVRKLERKERVFLAGCIKSMILADGRIEDEELLDVDKIVRTYHFDDYESSLLEFEHEVDREEDFESYARDIQRPEARDIILDVLNEVSVQDGYRDRDQDDLMGEIEKLWTTG